MKKLDKTLEDFATKTCKEWFKNNGLEFNLEAIRSKNRFAECIHLRRIVCTILRAQGFSLPDIGKYIQRHHASVYYMLTRKGHVRRIKLPDLSEKNHIIYSSIKYHQRRIELLRKELTAL